MIIIPLRRARSHKNLDPLRGEEFFQKYLKDNLAEFAPVHDCLETFSLLEEAEKALVIESLARKDLSD